jgi:AsmA protein
MIRLLILLIIAFATVLFLLLTALMVVPALVDPNDYKDQIRNIVQDKTGHSLLLHGDIGLSMSQFPQVTLTLGQSEIKNISGFSGNSLMVIDSINVGVELIPLLGEQLEVTHLSVSGLEVNLERDRSGWGNWQGEKAESKTSSSKPNTDSVPSTENRLVDGQQSVSVLAGLYLGGVNIADAQINYVDHGNGMAYALTDFSITTTPFAPGRESAITINGLWKGQNPVSDGSIDLKYRMSFDQSTREIKIRQLVMAIHGQRPGYAIEEVELVAKTDLVYKLKGGGLDLESADIGMKAWADGLSFRELGMEFKGSVAVAPGLSSVQLSKVALTTQVKSDTLPPAGIEFSTQSDISVDLVAATFRMAGLRVQGPVGMLITGDLSGKSLMSQPELAGNLKIDKFDLQALMIALGQPLPDPRLLNHAALATQFRVDSAGGEFGNINIQLDDTNLTGMVSISSLEKPAAVFDLKVDTLDLDRYLSDKKTVDVSGKVAVEGDNVTDTEQITDSSLQASLPLDFLRNIDLDGKLAVGRLKVRGLQVTDITMSGVANDGLISLTPVAAQLYEGRLLANMVLDLRQPEPQLKFGNQITGIQIGRLLNDLSGSEKLTGLTNLTTYLETQGFDSKSQRKNLQGTLSASVTDGEIRGMDVVHKIRALYAAVVRKTDRKNPVISKASTEATPFSKLTATATINNGVMENRDLRAISPILHLTGAGSVDLVAEMVDYSLNADVYSALKDLNPAKAEKLKGMVLPIHIKGPFSALDKPIMENLDFSSLLRSSLKTKLLEKGVKKLGGKEKIIKTLDRLEEKFGGKLPTEKLLKGLFGF